MRRRKCFIFIPVPGWFKTLLSARDSNRRLALMPVGNTVLLASLRVLANAYGRTRGPTGHA